MKILVKTLSGSHLYGTNVESSDLDYQAVHLPTMRELLLGRVQHYEPFTDRQPSSKTSSGEIDGGSHSVSSFLKMLSEGQMVAIDIFFSPPHLWEESDPAWEEILSEKPRLLTKRVDAMMGYCKSQAMKNGVKGDRLNVATSARDLFSSSAGSRRIDSHPEVVRDWVASLDPKLADHVELTTIMSRGSDGSEIECLVLCGRKIPFTMSFSRGLEIASGVVADYGRRAKAAASGNGVDWKALMHAVRIGEQSLEFLNDGHVTFPRPEADYLLAIRRGQVPFEEVSERVISYPQAISEASRESLLQPEVDKGWIDDFLIGLYEKYL